MKANDFKEFYNRNFFIDGVPAGAQAKVSFEIGGQTVEMQFGEIRPTATIHQMFSSYYQALAEDEERKERYLNGSNGSPDPEKVLNVERVGYKGNKYLVEERPDDVFVVRREDGSILGEDSPTTKAIIKVYKKAKEVE
jgi:hypothetical protein